RKMSAEEAGSQNPERHIRARSRHRLNPLARTRGCEKRLQFQDILRKILGIGRIAAQGAKRQLVRARRTAETKIDAAWKQGLQRAELLGDDMRSMVRQHDAAGAYANS